MICAEHVCIKCGDRKKCSGSGSMYCYSCKCENSSCPNLGTIKTRSGRMTCQDHLCKRCSSGCVVVANLCNVCKCSVSGCLNPTQNQDANACSQHLCKNCDKRRISDKGGIYCDACCCAHIKCTNLGTSKPTDEWYKFCDVHCCQNCSKKGIRKGSSVYCFNCKCHTKGCKKQRDTYPNCKYHHCGCGGFVYEASRPVCCKCLSFLGNARLNY